MPRLRLAPGASLLTLSLATLALVYCSVHSAAPSSAAPPTTPAPDATGIQGTEDPRSGPLAVTVGITDPDAILSRAPLPFQPYNTTFTEPVFGTGIRRVTNESGGGGYGTHIYSQLQAFSADNIYALLIEARPTSLTCSQARFLTTIPSIRPCS